MWSLEIAADIVISDMWYELVAESEPGAPMQGVSNDSQLDITSTLKEDLIF